MKTPYLIPGYTLIIWLLAIGIFLILGIVERYGKGEFHQPAIVAEIQEEEPVWPNWQGNAEAIVAQQCATCHCLGRRMCQPRVLQNIGNKRDLDWLILWIRDSEALIQSREPEAVATYNEFNQHSCPPHPDLSVHEILDIIASLTYE